MIVKIDKSFEKDVSLIKDAKVRQLLIEVINQLQQSQSIVEIRNSKKLKGFRNFYRIRLGNYRIGLKISDAQEIILIRFLHRKEIYQKWP